MHTPIRIALVSFAAKAGIAQARLAGARIGSIIATGIKTIPA